ncbi:MAG: protein phosphatase 2C domain-containing protein, partial [Treponema sp.]|nr:protein phosphatase 2C domain-containing protein [Treponema sp.]
MAAELFPFYLSVQGAAHERREKDAENAAAGRKFPCQDRSFAEKCELAGKRGGSCYVSCVCDGHGGAAYFRSGTGAALAVESIRTCVAASAAPLLRLIASSPSQAKATLQDLTRAILQDWCRRVDADLEICPITEKEWAFLDQDDPAAADRYRKGEDLRSIYGTTALACACGGGAWFALQIGDGDIVLHTEKKGFFKPVPEDERLFLNQTTSLCDTDAENEFRTACGREEPDAILCSSDGIANSFAGDKGLFEFYGKLLWLFRDWDG